MDNPTLAGLLRDPEAYPEIEPAERNRAATALERELVIPRMVEHLLALRALLAFQGGQLKSVGRDSSHFDIKVLDINNLLASVQDMPAVHVQLFPAEEGEN